MEIYITLLLQRNDASISTSYFGHWFKFYTV